MDEEKIKTATLQKKNKKIEKSLVYSEARKSAKALTKRNKKIDG